MSAIDDELRKKALAKADQLNRERYESEQDKSSSASPVLFGAAAFVVALLFIYRR